MTTLARRSPAARVRAHAALRTVLPRVPPLVRHLAQALATTFGLALVLAPTPAWAQRPGVAAGGSAAGLPEVPDPKDWARLSRPEQERRRGLIKQQLHEATPEQRQAYRRALRERLESLSPDERQALADQLRHRWQALPPEERLRLQQERREAIRAMPAEERRALQRERRQMLDKLSPEERRALREKLPAP